MFFCNILLLVIMKSFCSWDYITVLTEQCNFCWCILFLFYILIFYYIQTFILRIIIFNFHAGVILIFTVSSFLLFPSYTNQILHLFLYFNGSIYLCWNQTGCNILRWRSLFNLFQLQIGMWLFLIQLAVFCNQITIRRNWWIVIYIYIYIYIYVQYQVG